MLESDLGLYVVNLDGTGLTRLTREGLDSAPVWSPDATRIAFDRTGIAFNRPEVFDYSVIVVSADGSELRRLANGAGPQWSPDGTRIAFYRPEGDLDGVFVMNADGSGVRRLATGWGPEWSADGSTIGYESSVSGVAFGVIGPDGAGGRLVRGEVTDWEWAPDGQRIAFGLKNDPRLHLLEVGGGETRDLARLPATVEWVEWSPDGGEIVAEAGGAVQVVDVPSGRVTELARHGSAPLWSPDGTRVAFERRRTSDSSALVTIGRDGQYEHLIAVSKCAHSWWFDWVGDNGTLLFVKERSAGDGCDIWRAGADGEDARAITRAYPSGADFSLIEETPAGSAWAATTIPVRPAEQPETISPRPSRVAETKQLVYDLEADGRRAAIVTGPWGPVGIWDGGGRLRIISGTGVDYDRVEFAFAGTTAAWVEDSGGAPPTYYLGIATSAGDRDVIDQVWLGDNVSIGNLAGDGPLLVYNTLYWGKKPRPSKLWRIAGTGKQLILSGADAANVVAVDSGRIAVLRPDGKLVILNEHGKRLSAFRLGKANDQTIRLSGSQLVVLRGGELEVRDARTGKRKKRWPVSDREGPVRLVGAQGGLAVYIEGIAIHVLRLSDGRDVVLALPNEEGPAHADLEPEGLFYSYSKAGSTNRGRVAFVPHRELTRLLLRGS